MSMSNSNKEHLVIDKKLHQKLKKIAIDKNVTLGELTEDLILKALDEGEE